MNKIVKIIKNISESTITILGVDLSPQAIYTIPSCKWDKLRDSSDIITLIDSETIILNDGTNDLSIEGSKHLINIDQNEYNSSLAIDLNNIDQNITDNTWIEIDNQRVIWDLNSDFDLENNEFNVPLNGIYFIDVQIRIKNISSTADIELAIFKRIEGEPDDYWFILDKKVTISGETQLTAGTSFNFYKDEKYVIKIKVSGTNVNAIIDGSDDYTAWGITFEKALIS